MKRIILGLVFVLMLASGALAHSFGWNLDYDLNGGMYNLRTPIVADTKNWIPLPNSYIKIEPVITASRNNISNMRYNHIAALLGFKMPVAGGTLVVEGGPFYRLGRMVDCQALATTNSVYNTTTNTILNNTSVTNTITDTITNIITNTIVTDTTVVTFPFLPIADIISSNTTNTSNTLIDMDSSIAWGIPVTTTVTDSDNNTISSTTVVMSKYSKYQEPELTWGINAGWSISW